jgi:predicted oxidoreductase
MNRKLLYGCMHLGGTWDESTITTEQQSTADNLLDYLINDCGITDFDHADIYCKGKSEKIFGNYLKNQKIDRSKLFIQSKCGIQLGVGAMGSSQYCFDPNYIIEQVKISLENLQCGYLDALLLHRPDPLWHPGEVAETFEYLKNKKLVRSFGVSNFSSLRLDQLKNYFPEIFANQVQFSLGHSQLLYEEVVFNTNHSTLTDTGFMSYHQLNKIEIQAWGPLDQGKFISEGNDFILLKNKLKELSEEHHVSTEAILLAWVLRIPGNIVPILGSLKKERIANMLQAFEIELERKDWYDLWILSKEQKLP